MPERRTVKFKAWNASKTQSIRCSQSIRSAHGLDPAHGASLSRAIAKFHNAEIDHFGHNAFIHELIRGSLKLATSSPSGTRTYIIGVMLWMFKVLYKSLISCSDVDKKAQTTTYCVLDTIHIPYSDYCAPGFKP
jgi:hypothetical protein